MRLIVAGGRVGRYLTRRRVFAVLDDFATQWAGEEITVYTGDAVWVDTWALEWARRRGHRAVAVSIDGELDGYRENAPFNRNRRIYETAKPDCCLGFPGGGGTFDMMEICHDAGVPVGDVEINADGTWEIKYWPQK